MSRCGIWACAGLVFFLMLGSAAASPVADAVSGLHAALVARASAPATPTREKRKLTAADASLSLVTGDFDADDLRGIVGVGSKLVASRTSDAPVITAAGVFAQCLIDEAERREDEIVAALAAVLIPKTKASLQAMIDKARIVVTQTQALAATNPPAAIVRVRKGLVRYASISARVNAAVAAQANLGGPFVRQSVNSSLVINTSSGPVTITGVVCDVMVVPATSAPFHLTGDITADVPAGGAYALPFVCQPTRFFNLNNAVSYAVSNRIGTAELYTFSGSVQLKLLYRPAAYFSVAQ